MRAFSFAHLPTSFLFFLERKNPSRKHSDVKARKKRDPFKKKKFLFLSFMLHLFLVLKKLYSWNPQFSNSIQKCSFLKLFLINSCIAMKKKLGFTLQKEPCFIAISSSATYFVLPAWIFPPLRSRHWLLKSRRLPETKLRLFFGIYLLGWVWSREVGFHLNGKREEYEVNFLIPNEPLFVWKEY